MGSVYIPGLIPGDTETEIKSDVRNRGYQTADVYANLYLVK
jgi:hypothetical protein